MNRRTLPQALIALAALAQPLLAQIPGKVAGEESSYLHWLILTGVAVIVCATGFLNAKRSHLN